MSGSAMKLQWRTMKPSGSPDNLLKALQDAIAKR